MGRVIFMCGPAGSGKSTVAREYEQQGMARLSFDQEAWSHGITTMPLAEDVRRDIEHVLRARLVGLVQAGSGDERVGSPHQGGDDFAISTELAASYFDHFEIPTAAEGPLIVMK